MVMPSGMSVHVSSSGSEPSMCSDLACTEWRYFTANTNTSAKISSVKNTDTATRKKYSPSTWEAIDDACSGNSGKFFHIIS